jgi:hypothetical protein
MPTPSLLSRLLVVAGLCLLTCGGIRQAHANTFVVTSTANTGGDVCGTTCTLPQAMNEANANSDSDTIIFDPVVFASKQTIAVGLGIMSDVNIIGPTTPGSGLTLSGGIRVDKGNLTLANLTVTSGHIGLLVIRGNITIDSCTFSGNEMAIFNASLQHGMPTEEERRVHPGRLYAVLDEASTVTANNCTISNNFYGAYNAGGPIILNSCTITGNKYGVLGFGFNSAQTLSNCLVVGNSILNTYNTVGEPSAFIIDACSITSGTAEEVGLDPEGLRDNGGPTATVALVTGSSALGAGQTTLATDQRGTPRSKTSGSDVGAYQSQPRPSSLAQPIIGVAPFSGERTVG